MRSGGIIWGGIILFVGVILLAGNLFNINLWPYFFPGLLILAGLWILLWSRVGVKPMESQSLRIPLDGAARGEVKIRHGAGHLVVGGGAGQDLVAGTFGGGVDHRESRNGDLLRTELRVPDDAWFRGGGVWFVGPWSTINWDLQLNTAVPMSVDLETGAGESRVDLSQVRAEDISLKTGASATELTLPAAGRSHVRINSGVAHVMVRVPEGVAARIRVQSGLAGIGINESRFPRTSVGYESPNFAQAANAADIEVETGVSSLEIR